MKMLEVKEKVKIGNRLELELFLKFTKVILWLSIVTLSFLMLCTANYCLSLWIFLVCGYSYHVFIPTFSLVFIMLSLFIYIVVDYITKRQANKIMETLSGLGIVDFSDVMSKYKAKEIKRRRKVSENRTCLVCYENEAKTITYPCKHEVMCGQCAWTYIGIRIKESQSFTCILCRTLITDIHGDMNTSHENFDIKLFQNILRDRNYLTDDKIKKMSTRFQHICERL